MDLHYYRDPVGNFGDDLNCWLWDALLPGWRDWDSETTMFGVGTLLNEERLRPFSERQILVIGSGVGYGSGPPRGKLPARWDIRSVRGPLSAASLGIPAELGVADPAIMISELSEFKGLGRSGSPVFVPHHRSVERQDWAAACAGAGLAYVSPCDDSRSVIRAIASAPLVLAEAMHAAIIADSFRVPWIPVSIGSQFNQFKWEDWARSVGVAVEIPHIMPAFQQVSSFLSFPRGKRFQGAVRRALEKPMLVSALRKNMERDPLLSPASVLEGRKRDYRLILDRVMMDYGS